MHKCGASIFWGPFGSSLFTTESVTKQDFISLVVGECADYVKQLIYRVEMQLQEDPEGGQEAY